MYDFINEFQQRLYASSYTKYSFSITSKGRDLLRTFGVVKRESILKLDDLNWLRQFMVTNFSIFEKKPNIYMTSISNTFPS